MIVTKTRAVTGLARGKEHVFAREPSDAAFSRELVAFGDPDQCRR